MGISHNLSRYKALSSSKVVPDQHRCVQCGICSYNCPLGIDVREYAWRGEAILESRCITCAECIKRCPRGTLRFEPLQSSRAALSSEQ